MKTSKDCYQTPHIQWSDWQPLFKAGRNKAIPTDAGLYRIRIKGEKTLKYLGQTGANGRGLRGRLGQLNGIYGELMPYNDPHTAGPALWALLKDKKVDLEVSVFTLPSDTKFNRKGMECFAIYCHRKQFGFSPSFNFGRMPVGYSKSSQNNAALVKAGKRFRGSETKQVLNCHNQSAKIIQDINAVWGEQRPIGWSSWQSAKLANFSFDPSGVYVIKSIGNKSATYVGEGNIVSRLKSHLAKGRSDTHPQRDSFCDPEELYFSFLETSHLEKNQMLEIENDLIGCHVGLFGFPPVAQFLG